MIDADFFITGHQPCERVSARQTTARSSSTEPTQPCYCLFPATEPVSIESLLKCVHAVDVLAV